MGKVATSPVGKFSGSVTICDPLNMAQTLGWEKAMRDARALMAEIRTANPDNFTEIINERISELNAVYLPGLLGCVEEWHLNGVPSSPTYETFPLTPHREAARLIDWLIGEVLTIWAGEGEDGEKNA
jgi:hypothetical protein